MASDRAKVEDESSTDESCGNRPVDFYGLLEDIRRLPALYIGRKSLRDFRAWLLGYRAGRMDAGIQPDDQQREFDDEFDSFVCSTYRWHDTGGWAAKIAYYERDDAMAFDEFFRLLDKFRTRKG